MNILAIAPKVRRNVIRFRLLTTVTFVFLALLIVEPGLMSQSSYEQSTVAVPAFSPQIPVENGSIDAGNGNLHIEIPLGTFQERGGPPFTAELVYDSKIWAASWGYWNPDNVHTFHRPFWFQTFGGQSWGGWRIHTSVDRGSVIQSGYDEYCDDEHAIDNVTSFTFEDSNGGFHGPMGGWTDYYADPYCYRSTELFVPDSAWALDQSGYRQVVNSLGDWAIYAPGGYDVGGRADSNGNSYSPSFTDTGSPLYDTVTSSVTDQLGRTVFSTSKSGNTATVTILNSGGSSSTFTIHLRTINVHTDFMKAYNSEYSGSITIVDSVDLPDSTSYSFGYEEGTSAGNYGLVTSMTLPTTGTVSYGYDNFTDANGDKTRWVTSRTTPDSTTPWTITPQVNSSCPPYFSNCEQQSTVEKPSGDHTVYVFTVASGNYSTEERYYTGSVSSSNLLATVDQSYIYVAGSGCGGQLDGCAFPSLGVVPVSRTTTIGSVSSTIKRTFDSSGNGNVTKLEEWDFGSSTSGAADRTTNTTYLTGAGNIAANLVNHPTIVTVTDASGHLCSETDYAYDAATPDSSGVTQQHSSVSTARGNVTSMTRKLFSNPCQSSSPTTTSLTTTYTVYDTGKVHTSTDPNGNTTTYTYSNYGAYVSEIQHPDTVTNGTTYHHIEDFTYNANTGSLATHSDENGQTTSFSYDNMERPTETDFPDGGEKHLYYPDANTIEQTIRIDSSRTTDSLTFLDGLGRQSQTKTAVPSSTCAGGYVYVDVGYDVNGRKGSNSNPDCSSATSDDVKTTFDYDGLDRTTSVTNQDSTTVTTSYTNNCATTTDEASKARKSCSDALGRVTGVWEDPSSTNYETDYTYNLNNDLIQVQQRGGDSNSGNWRMRTFTYDSLSRLTSSLQPESGTAAHPEYGLVSYTYDGNGNIATKVAPQVDQTGSATTTTAYCYDAVNRLIQKRYTAGSCPLSSPDVSYVYDGASVPSGCSVGSFSFGSYPKPRRTSVCDGSGSEALLYDKMGRVLTDQRTTNSITKAFTYTYNLDGSPASLVYPSSHTINYAVDIAERMVSAVDSGSSINYVIGPTNCPNGQSASGLACYTPQNTLAALTNGSSMTTTSYYNSRLQPCRLAANSSGTTAPTSCTDSGHNGDVMDLTYDFDLGSTDNGNVKKITDNANTAFNFNYTYDALNRIASYYTDATTGSNCHGQAYTIDPWGNLTGIGDKTGYTGTGCTREMLGITVGPKNEITSSGFNYDVAGNLISDGSLSPQHDTENRITSVASTTYYYDADGKRVRKSSGTMYWYGTSSDPLLETDGSGNLTYEYMFFGGKRIARRDSSGNILYYAADHLDSTRAVYNVSNSTFETCHYYPYGGELSSCFTSSSNHYKFTGKERDSESGLDDFDARYFSPQWGRFMTADTPLVDQDTDDPQSWNLYAYARNNPLSFNDPTGHCAEGQDGLYRDTKDQPCVQKEGTQITVKAKAGPAISAFAANLVITIMNLPNQYFSLATMAIGVTPSYMQNIPTGSGFAAQAGAAAGTIAGLLIGPEGEGAEIETIADKIATGHALGKHSLELGTTSVEELKGLVTKVISDASGADVRQLSGGRIAYWSEEKGAVVIYNPKTVDRGTVFVPRDGRAYFEKLR